MRKLLYTLAATALVCGLTLIALPSSAASKGAAPASLSPAAQTLESFKALAGTWEGANEHGKAKVTYTVVAGGSAVLERLAMPNHDEMVTVYHLDGERLLLTHYCVVGNQPRMEARHFGAGQVSFEMVDGTNLGSSQEGHMHKADFRFDGSDHLVSAWTWQENGKDAGTVTTRLSRID
jgi:hypothetical protein